MTKINIRAQVPGFTGQVIGVPFIDSAATIEIPRQQAAYEYFTRHGYVLTEAGEAPAKGADSSAGAGSGNSADHAALDKLTIPDLIALAGERGYELGSAKKKGEIIAVIVAQETEAAQRRDAAASADTAAGNVGAGDQTGSPAGVGTTDVNADNAPASAEVKGEQVAAEAAAAQDAADATSAGNGGE